MKDKIEYYDSAGNCKEIEVNLRFLTPKLRVDIIKHDTDSQLAFKKHIKKLNLGSGKAKIDMNAEKVAKHIEKVKLEHPDYGDAQLKTEEDIFTAEMLADMDDKDIRKNVESGIKLWGHNDEMAIKFFRLIIDMTKLSDDAKSLINSELSSDFWQNADIGKVVEINQSFRTKYQI